MRLVALALASSLFLQNASPSAGDLIRLQRPLSQTEIATVIRGIRDAVAGVTIRLVRETAAPVEILMSPAGRPLMIRTRLNGPPGTERVAGIVREVAGKTVSIPVPEPDVTEQFVSLNEYTWTPARRCNGTAATADLVIQYFQDPATQKWTATAREWTRHDTAMALPLDILGASALPAIGEMHAIGTRTARAIVSPLPEGFRQVPVVIGDPAPNPDEFAPMQTLWVDTVSLRPIRWETSQRQAITSRVDFVYEAATLQRPAGVEAPRCIS